MRCPTCNHENPKNTPRCEACGAALSAGAGASPVNPGRRVTSFEPAPFLPFTPAPPTPLLGEEVPPPPDFSTASFAPTAPVPRQPPPAPFSPASVPFAPNPAPYPPAAPYLPASSPATASPTGGFPSAPTEGRRTVAEALPVLPPVPGPASALPPNLAPAAPPPNAPMPSPFGVPLPVTSLAGQPLPGAPPGAGATPSGSLGSPLSMPLTGGLPMSTTGGLSAPVAGRVEATRLAQNPEVGGAPQLRGALFEYRGLGHQGFIHTLREGRNVLGRDAAVCDVILEEERASKQHAFLFIRDEDVSYLDISSNGSTIDGRPVRGTEVKLSSPSVIQIGGLRLIFVFLPRRLVDGLL